MNEMTARERIETVFNHGEPDRVPVYDIIHNIPIMEHFAGERITNDNAFDVSLRGIGRALDMTRCIAIPHTGERVHVESQGFTYDFDWWTFVIKERPYRDVQHLAECVRREIDNIREAMSRGRLTADATLIAQLTASDAQTPEEVHDVFARMCRALGDCVLIHPESIVGLTTAYTRAGWELFIYLMGDQPELVNEWLTVLCDYEVWRIHHIADPELSPVAMVADDLAGKQGLFFSPRWLRQNHFPLVKRCVEAWHAHGIKVIFHSDGYKMDIMDDLLACGIDAINPLEPTTGMTVPLVREKYPDLIVTSMIDCDQLLPYGPPEEVAAACRQAIDDGARGGAFLLGSSSEIHPEVPLENFLAMIEVARTYGHYSNREQWGTGGRAPTLAS
jgi:hypothetical protein